MILRVLGSAAGGGVPQWNCGCPNCAAVRNSERPARSESSIAVSADGERWVLFNVSNDIGRQIEACTALQPRGVRGTPIASIALTDANVDHLGGFVTLRQSGNHAFTVRSSAEVHAIATAQPAFATFDRPPHRWLICDEGQLPPSPGDPIGGDLDVRAIPVPGLTPGYAGRRAVRGAVTAYAVRDVRGGPTVLIAPVFAAVDAVLGAALAAADVAFLDGSFFADDEMLVADVGDKRASALGHAPLDGSGGTLAALDALAQRPASCYLTHVNNTNPVLDERSPERARLLASGVNVAYDGLTLAWPPGGDTAPPERTCGPTVVASVRQERA